LKRSSKDCTASPARGDGSRRKAKVDGVLVVDDYGHHPTEIRATLARRNSVLVDAGSWCCFNRIVTRGRTI
jgi:hypothetical protein